MILASHFAILLACLCALAFVASGKDADEVKRTEGFLKEALDDVNEKHDITRRKRNDDVDLRALQTIVQQQAATIQQMQSQLTASQNEISSLKNSLPSTFSPVAFSVRFSKDSSAGLDMSTHSVLKFDHIVTNLGNGYSPQTGIFTAPHAGTYCFSVNFMSVNGLGHTYVAIDKHGTLLDYAFANGHDDYDQGSAEVVVHLAKGEQVWARQENGHAVRGGLFTVFTGYLVQAD